MKDDMKIALHLSSTLSILSCRSGLNISSSGKPALKNENTIAITKKFHLILYLRRTGFNNKKKIIEVGIIAIRLFCKLFLVNPTSER